MEKGDKSHRDVAKEFSVARSTVKLGIHGATKSLATRRAQQIAPCSVQGRDDFYLAIQVARDRIKNGTGQIRRRCR